MYGTKLTEKINLGRGGHIKWINGKDKKNKGGDKNFNSSGAKDIYSGGGYGTPGKSIIDYSTNGQFQIINGISPNPQYKSRNNFKNKKDKSQPNGEILCGGHVYGTKELDTLYYGSSGGKGAIANNYINYYSVSDRGGGIIELIAQKIENHGTIIANGKTGRPGGQWFSAGSGGSIKIKCKQFLLGDEASIKACGGKLPPVANKNQMDDKGDIKCDENYQ
eukprot:899583_1